MTVTSLEIVVGAFAPKVLQQVREQGIQITARIRSAASQAQHDVDASNRLRIRGILTDAEAKRVNQRIVNRLTSAVSQVPLGDGQR